MKEYIWKSSKGCSLENSKALVIAYIFLTLISTYSLCGNERASLKVASLAFLALAFVYLLVTARPKYFTATLKMAERFFAFTIGMLVWTLYLYIINFESMNVISRGIQKIGYQMIVVVLAAVPVIVFGTMAVDYTFYGLWLCYIVNIIIEFGHFGPSASISSFIYFVHSGGDAVDFMKKLEVHDAVFAFTLFLLYYIFMEKHDAKNICKICMATICCLLGLKRIAIGSMVLAGAVWFLLRKMSLRQIKRLCLIIGILACLIGFLYVWISASGIMAKFYAENDINDMGRSRIYEIIRPYYGLGITYQGHGFEYITKLFESLKKVDGINLARAKALHNGYLTMYIELGFVGFFLWEEFWLVYLPQFIARFGKRALINAEMLIISSFFTYLTDNTAFYFFTGLAFRMLLIQGAITSVGSEDNSEKSFSVQEPAAA